MPAENQSELTTNAVESSSGKGHSTPKRKESQTARQRPLVASDRKAAKAANRAARNAAYEKQQYAMKHGIEKDLPYRDQGKARRFARDYIDAQFNLGELFLPVAFVLMIVVLILGASQQYNIYMYATFTMYGLISLAIAHAALAAFLMQRQLKRFVPAEDIPRGTSFYAFQRAFQMRRWRLPKAQVARGEWPQDKLEAL